MLILNMYCSAFRNILYLTFRANFWNGFGTADYIWHKQSGDEFWTKHKAQWKFRIGNIKVFNKWTKLNDKAVAQKSKKIEPPPCFFFESGTGDSIWHKQSGDEFWTKHKSQWKFRIGNIKVFNKWPKLNDKAEQCAFPEFKKWMSSCSLVLQF